MNKQGKYRYAVMSALGATMFAGAALAASSPADVESQYRQEVARCNSGQSNQDKATCLREAGAARDAARQGNLSAASADEYKRNQLRRCEVLPASDRASCVARIEQGTVSGSVEGGGVLREYREYSTPAAPPSPVPRASPPVPLPPANPGSMAPMPLPAPAPVQPMAPVR